jgi:hypothetical protein
MRRALLAVSLVGALVLGGCARRAPRPLRPASAEQLLDSVEARRAAITTLRARARLRTGLSALWTREALLVRRPDQVRIDVLSPFGLALAVGIRGGLLWAYPPSEATRYEGAATPESLARFLGAPVAVADVVDVLLGVPPARQPVAPVTLAATREGDYRLTLPLAGGTQTIWFAGDTLAVRRAEEARDGSVVMQVGFDDYRDGFPHLVEVGTAGGAGARLAYDAVEANAPVEPAVFVPPAARRVLPLAAAPRAEER